MIEQTLLGCSLFRANQATLTCKKNQTKCCWELRKYFYFSFFPGGTVFAWHPSITLILLNMLFLSCMYHFDLLIRLLQLQKVIRPLDYSLFIATVELERKKQKPQAICKIFCAIHFFSCSYSILQSGSDKWGAEKLMKLGIFESLLLCTLPVWIAQRGKTRKYWT